MGQNVDKWVKYFNGCCMWTNETLLSVSACNEPHVAGGRGVYLLVFTWYLYWRIWSLLQLSAVSPGQAIIQLLSHQLPVTTSTHRDTSIINSNVGILGFISQLGFNQTGLKSFNWRVKFYNSAGNEIIYRV